MVFVCAALPLAVRSGSGGGDGWLGGGGIGGGGVGGGGGAGGTTLAVATSSYG